MLIYFILLVLAPIGMLLAQLTSVRDKLFSKFFMYSVSIMLILVAGLRSSDVGTDTNNYVYSFGSERVEDSDILDNPSTSEIGYLFIEKTARNLSNEYWVLLMLIAIVVVGFNMRTIYVLSENYAISIFVFIALGSYVFFFNGARQGLAAGIFGISMIYLMKGNFKKYLLWIMIAFLFHRTVLIAIPLYFLFRTTYSLKNLIITTSLLVLFITSINFILRFFPDTFGNKYLAYEDRGASGAVLLTVFFVMITVIFIHFRQFIAENDLKYYDIYLNATIFTALIYVLVQVTGQDVNMVRLTLYSSFGIILIWPIIFRNVSYFRSPLPRLGFFIGHFVFFYIYLNKMSNLVPYSFSSEWLNSFFY